MQHSQSDVALGTNGSWADLKIAEGLKKRSNTAQNLQFYVEEQKRLYQELPFSVLPGMRRQSFQRERSFSNLKSRSSWGSFTNLVARGEDQPLLGADDEFPEPGYTFPLLLSCGVALMSAFQFGYNTGVTGGINPDIIFPGHSDMLWAVCVSIFAPRPTAMSIATMVNWSCSFLVGLTFPTMQRELGEYTFVPFCAALCLALAFTLKYVPETKGKTIQEIQDELRLKKKQSMEV
ncbi:hypothetical protein PI126_g11412 [Phytophthora idaei]|nr:hypothetical protein PI126_g11412 [Phytophthora idaei]